MKPAESGSHVLKYGVSIKNGFVHVDRRKKKLLPDWCGLLTIATAKHLHLVVKGALTTPSREPRSYFGFRPGPTRLALNITTHRGGPDRAGVVHRNETIALRVLEFNLNSEHRVDLRIFNPLADTGLSSVGLCDKARRWRICSQIGGLDTSTRCLRGGIYSHNGDMGTPREPAVFTPVLHIKKVKWPIATDSELGRKAHWRICFHSCVLEDRLTIVSAVHASLVKATSAIGPLSSPAPSHGSPPRRLVVAIPNLETLNDFSLGLCHPSSPPNVPSGWSMSACRSDCGTNWKWAEGTAICLHLRVRALLDRSCLKRRCRSVTLLLSVVDIDWCRKHLFALSQYSLRDIGELEVARWKLLELGHRICSCRTSPPPRPSSQVLCFLVVVPPNTAPTSLQTRPVIFLSFPWFYGFFSPNVWDGFLRRLDGWLTNVRTWALTLELNDLLIYPRSASLRSQTNERLQWLTGLHYCQSGEVLLPAGPTRSGTVVDCQDSMSSRRLSALAHADLSDAGLVALCFSAIARRAREVARALSRPSWIPERWHPSGSPALAVNDPA
ncbi:hypothetical protein CC2G_003103 [Coprinopsis cinerea AmutBmut pab1-1]|nr:hypothetical protein CC2G_003103 [Coprinopsis cinerea AmutBmut pab1-1]